MKTFITITATALVASAVALSLGGCATMDNSGTTVSRYGHCAFMDNACKAQAYSVWYQQKHPDYAAQLKQVNDPLTSHADRVLLSKSTYSDVALEASSWLSAE